MNDLNATNYSGEVERSGFTSDEDYVDKAIKLLMAAQLPVYGATNKMVSPPIVAMRIGNEIFIKGILKGSAVTYNKPILRNGKYASMDVSIKVEEIEPYDAEMVAEVGSYRLATTLNRNIYSFKYYTPGQFGGAINSIGKKVMQTK